MLHKVFQKGNSILILQYKIRVLEYYVDQQTLVKFFYTFKASYDLLYEASQMFCFDYAKGCLIGK